MPRSVSRSTFHDRRQRICYDAGSAPVAHGQVSSIIRTLEADVHWDAPGPMLVREHPSRDGALTAAANYIIRDVAGEYGGRPVLRYIGSDNSEDRHISVLEQGPGAVTVKYYEANPAFCWSHQYGIPIIGNCVGLDLQKNRTVFDIEFLIEEWELPNTANLSKLVYRLAKISGDAERGLRGMPASSVGFIPELMEEYESKSENVPWFVTPTRYLKWELLELSSVTIPSNRNALKKSLEMRDLTENEIDFLGLGRFMAGAEPLILHMPKARVARQTDERPNLPIAGGLYSPDGRLIQPRTPEPEPGIYTALPALSGEIVRKKAAGEPLSAEEQQQLDAFAKALKQFLGDRSATPAVAEIADVVRSFSLNLVDAIRFLEAWRSLTPEQRAGAVLSRKNATRLQDSMELLSRAIELQEEVLTEAGYPPEEPVPAEGEDADRDLPAVADLTALLETARGIEQSITNSDDSSRTGEPPATPAPGARAADDGDDADVVASLSQLQRSLGELLTFDP